MRFYDRKKELEFFEGLKDKNGKKLVVVHGRRRVGKTTLLKRALKDAAYFFVDTRNCEDLLREFSGKISRGVYTKWEDFLRDLFEMKRSIVFDEFQNFRRTCPHVLSIFQKVWDDFEGDALLVLCGSHSGMMKRIFEDGKSPLFGRADHIVNLKPFDFLDAFEMLRDFGYSLEESIIWYSILGGVPKYLWHLEEKEPIEEKLYRLFFDDFAPLREEGRNLLILEFGREHPGYFSVLRAIGNFESDLGEIVARSSLERTTAMKYLSELRDDYGIVEEVENLLLRKKRGKRYKIADFFLRFWMRFVYGQIDTVEVNPELALNITLKNLPQHVGMAFEDIVMKLIPVISKQGLIPPPLRIGKGWMKIDGQIEVDVFVECESCVVIVECKWREKPFGHGDLKKLLWKLESIPSSKEKRGIVISKGGFSVPRIEGVTFLGLDDLEGLLYNPPG